MDRPLTIEHGSNRFGPRPAREPAPDRARSSLSSRACSSSSARSRGGSVVLVAIVAVALYVDAGRNAGRQELRELAWIFAVSQLAVVLVPALALVLTAFAVVALVVLAVVALVVLLRDRR